MLFYILVLIGEFDKGSIFIKNKWWLRGYKIAIVDLFYKKIVLQEFQENLTAMEHINYIYNITEQTLILIFLYIH